jgi:type IV secretory pathway TraG/TraD family ATPase VirD4
MNNLALRNWGVDSRKYTAKERFLAVSIGLFYTALAFAAFCLIDLIRYVDYIHQQQMPTSNPHFLLAILYLVLFIAGLVTAAYFHIKQAVGNLYIVAITVAGFVGIVLMVTVEFILQMLFAKAYTQSTGYSFSAYMYGYWESFLPVYAIVALILGIVLCTRWRFRAYKMNVQRSSRDTSGNLGSARMATEQDLTEYGLRTEQGGLLGKDRVGYLRLPKLLDRLILAFRGLGKSSALLIPLIIDYLNVNKLIIDVKGELAAVTARMAAKAGRIVYIIDPFLVLKSLGLEMKTHTINPLAHINESSPMERDRSITSLATALCSHEHRPTTESEAHFAENAQIILEGILDFYLTKFQNKPDKLNLVSFHDWWLTVVSDEENTALKEMKSSTIKARAAVAQMSVAGKDESGSFKTTVYRQLQWLRSESIRNTFIDDEVDMDSFITGKCDIYIVLPEDMVGTYSRLARVVMALVKVKLIQAPINELQPNYCFMLDELGQFGYCPDVEQAINTMRARGLRIIAVFQTTTQVELYKDDATFKGMPVKHFLGGDDEKALKWIQLLGDKKTVLVETVSRNSSAPMKGGLTSVSENVSISETATDLIHKSEFRELPDDEQFIFIKGMRPIRCKKAFYYNEPNYKGRYHENPIEVRGKLK